MNIKRALLALLIFLVIADGIVAYGFSAFFTEKLLRVVNKEVHARVAFREVRVHPLFLSLSAKEIEIFDPDAPRLRVLYSQRMSARVDLLPLLFKNKITLSALRFDKFRMKVIKDMHGVLNVEKILEPEPALLGGSFEGRPVRFHGSKHEDWFFNAYERIRFAVMRPSDELLSETPLFKIKDIRLSKGLLVLVDRSAKPVVFRDIRLSIKNLRWFRSGAVCLDSVFAGGNFKTSRNGYFDISISRERKGVHIFMRLRNVDLELLKSMYNKTSPVYFDRGFITWTSSSHLSAESVYSANRIKIDAHLIRSAAGWSEASEAVIRAVNRHPGFELNFQITGTPDHLLFQGFDKSLLNILKNDFNKSALALIQHRTAEELGKIASRLGSS